MVNKLLYIYIETNTIRCFLVFFYLKVEDFHFSDLLGSYNGYPGFVMDLTIWIMPIRVDVDFLCMDLTAQSSPNGLIGREREREQFR